MQIDPEEVSVRELYQWMVALITPRPIAWVSTISAKGNANLAPYSFFNGVGANPPLLMFCPANDRDGNPKHTLANVRETSQFVVNLVTEEFAEQMNQSSAMVAADVDEFDFANVVRASSAVVAAPRVAGSKASFECALHEELALGDGPGGANLVIGRILHIQVSDELLDEESRLVDDKLNTVGRMGGDSYTRTHDRFRLPRPRVDSD